MDINRLRTIIEYSKIHREDIDSKIKNFYAFTGMSSDKEVLNIMQIARPSFREKGYLVLELPFADEEIGALCYHGDAIGYTVLNTSLPKVNVNFALCHELYHVFYEKSQSRTKVEFANYYADNTVEFAANLFAGALLMPETSFRFMYTKFKQESNNDEIDTIVRLMNYYQTPYMATLIRCYELGLPDTERVTEELLHVDKSKIRERFAALWLDTEILNATKKDDYAQIEALVARMGDEYVSETYLSQRTLTKVLKNMKQLYADIKGDV